MAITKKEKKGMSNADKKTGKAVGNKEGKGMPSWKKTSKKDGDGVPRDGRRSARDEGRKEEASCTRRIYP